MWQPLDGLAYITGAQLREGGANPPAGSMVTQEELLDDKVVQGLPEPDSRLLNEVRLAYADHDSPLIPSRMAYERHCKRFLTSDWFTDGTALARAFTIIGAADCFDAQGVADVTRTINDYAPDARVVVGREEDPVIYVECDNPAMAVDMLEREADWVTRLSYPSIRKHHGEDVFDQDDMHNGCEHHEPPVPNEQAAVANDPENVVWARWNYE